MHDGINVSLQPKKMLTTTAHYIYNISSAQGNNIIITHSIQFQKALDNEISNTKYSEYDKQKYDCLKYKS